MPKIEVTDEDAADSAEPGEDAPDGGRLEATDEVDANDVDIENEEDDDGIVSPLQNRSLMEETNASSAFDSATYYV